MSSVVSEPVATSAQATVTAHKRQLAEGRSQLRATYLERPAPRQLLRAHTALVDRVLRSVWTESAMPPEVALLAVGGYGRGQLFPYSDVDVLFLLPDDLHDAAKEKVSNLVGSLWDIGLEIGHSARTVEQCVAEKNWMTFCSSVRRVGKK